LNSLGFIVQVFLLAGILFAAALLVFSQITGWFKRFLIKIHLITDIAMTMLIMVLSGHSTLGFFAGAVAGLFFSLYMRELHRQQINQKQSRRIR
jgi:hypothetical protein